VKETSQSSGLLVQVSVSWTDTTKTL